MKYEEKEARGSFDFPISYYYLNKAHLRYIMRCHWHQEPELIHIFSGRLQVTIGGETFDGKAGDIFYVNSTYLHSAIPEDCVYECMVCEQSLLDAECRNLLKEYVFPTKLTGKAHDFAAYLLKALSEKPTGWKFSVRGAFSALYGELLSGNGVVERQSLRVQHSVKKAIRYIEENFSEPIMLSDLSSISGLSPKYFERIFKEMTGKSPMKYLNAYRIFKATERLRMTNDSITEIAFDCGFSDLSYFIKHFKCEQGVTPSGFRKSQQKFLL